MSDESGADRWLVYRQGYTRYEQQVEVFGSFSRSQDEASVVPGTEFEVRFFARGMPLRLEVSATRGPGEATGQTARIRASQIFPFDPFNPGILDPTGDPPIPPDPTPVSSYQAAVTLRLHPPGGGAPFEWTLPEGTVDWNTRRITFPEGLPHPSLHDLTGWWRLSVTPTSPFPVRMLVSGAGRLARVPVQTRDISARLLNRVFALALDAIALRATFVEGTYRVTISPEIAALIGQTSTLFEASIAPISAPSLERLGIEVVAGQVLLDRLDARIARLPPLFASALRARRDELAPLADRIAVRIQAAFTDRPIEVYGLDLAEINGDAGEIFLVFSPDFTSFTPVVLLSVDLGTVLEVVDALPIIEVPRNANDLIEAKFYEYQREILSYFRAALGRLVARDAVALRARWAGASLRVEYFIDPPQPTAANTPPDTLPGIDIAGGPDAVGRFDAGTGGGGGSAGPVEPLGVFPPGFEVVGGAALTRLDRVQSLVVIMMENRSFDHLLGDLPRVRPRVGDRYDGIPAGASNAPAGGFAGRVPMVRARDIGLDTQIPVSPNHHHGPVMFQIGGGTPETAGSGAMDGFARDLAHRTDAPQIALTYYEEPDLPVYYRLADEYLVCDRWFCAHPGPTWPNRWITVCGTTPELENPENDDPRLGYMTEPTIFETLTQHGISWKYFESDLSLIRLFDRYRIDDTNVLPLGDLDAVLASPGPLPRVMFIEPNFIDVPGGVANDDHPPADLAEGQAFIAGILEKLRTSGRWGDITLLITYDEHGGFYDHVAPPGTAQGDPAWLGRIARVHPQGPDFLGVRVPAFVVSPYVAGPSISHVVFDHTSIIKTILVHNRQRLPQSAFGRFGARVCQAAHLGQVLTEDAPRPAPTRPYAARQPPATGVAWTDPASDPNLVFDPRQNLYVHTKTGWLVMPDTGAILDADSRAPIAEEVALETFPDRVVRRSTPVVWADPAFGELTRNDRSGALVHERTGYLVDERTGTVLDPRTRAPLDADTALAALGDKVRVASEPARGAVRRVVRAAPESRDFHQSLRDLCKPRRRYT